MFTRIVPIFLILTLSVFGIIASTQLLAPTKIHDPVGKIQLFGQIKALEKDYREAARVRHELKTRTGDFSDVDPVIYDEFESLVENDFQNTSDQLDRARSEYQRYR